MEIRRIPKFLAGALVAASLAVSCGGAFAINVTAKINGNNVVIGDIAASAGIYNPTTGVETGTFFLNDTYKNLMDDDCGNQFRWVQIITDDSCPAKWKGNNITFGIDPPKGGWDYQKGDGGADNAPFYENNDGGVYAYPNYAARHDQALGKSWTNDFPGICPNPNDNTTWQTYLVFYNPTRMGQSYSVLAGYTWSVGRDGTGNPVYSGPTFYNAIGQANINDLTTAMNNTGFGNWTATFGDDIGKLAQCPEPSSVAVFLVFSAGLVLLIVRRRMRAGRSGIA
jgi:hypothetical protein